MDDFKKFILKYTEMVDTPARVSRNNGSGIIEVKKSLFYGDINNSEYHERNIDRINFFMTINSLNIEESKLQIDEATEYLEYLNRNMKSIKSSIEYYEQKHNESIKYNRTKAIYTEFLLYQAITIMQEKYNLK